jgi:beta-D-galactosyl-(1->4)-L-rhamnose phosphorylase
VVEKTGKIVRSLKSLTQWVHEGGCFFGINQPSAVEGFDHYYRMAHVLGVDEDTGSRVSHGKWKFEEEIIEGLIPEGCMVAPKKQLFLTNPRTQVWMSTQQNPTLTHHSFGKGCGIYMPSFEVTSENTKLLFNLLLHLEGRLHKNVYVTDNSATECAYFPESQALIVMNNSQVQQKTTIRTEQGALDFELQPFETRITQVR